MTKMADNVLKNRQKRDFNQMLYVVENQPITPPVGA